MKNRITQGAIFCILLLLFLQACKKEEPEPSDIAITYAELLEAMELDCPEEKSSNYMEAYINGEQVCYYDSIDNRELSFGITANFTTPSPDFSTGNTISDVRRGANLCFGYYPSIPWGEDFVEIEFPEVEITRDTCAYLDSVFAVVVHEVQDTEEDRNDFLINFNLAEPARHSGTLLYPISTRFGEQTGSYVRFNEVRKTIEDGAVYYYIDMDFECKLYHWPQYDREGLWGTLEGGKVVAKLKVQ